MNTENLKPEEEQERELIDELTGSIDRTAKKACITDIQRFSVHDGPGIRTMVFFKGCPLRCLWCQNPETQDVRPQIMYLTDECIGCTSCLKACPQHAIQVDAGGVHYDRMVCRSCGACSNVCVTGARKLVGEMRPYDEVLKTVLKDRVFYKNTGGGLTCSGGEPTMHAEFVARLFRDVKDQGINTAIETCGMCSEDRFDLATENSDLLLYDVKHTNSDIHKKYTGVGNELILKNLFRAAERGKHIIIRIPLIPTVNDGEKNLQEVARIAREYKIEEIHLLPFHQMGQGKWHGLDKEYAFETFALPTQEVVDNAEAILKASGAIVNVGGYGEYHPEEQ